VEYVRPDGTIEFLATRKGAYPWRLRFTVEANPALRVMSMTFERSHSLASPAAGLNDNELAQIPMAYLRQEAGRGLQQMTRMARGEIRSSVPLTNGDLEHLAETFPPVPGPTTDEASPEPTNGFLYLVAKVYFEERAKSVDSSFVDELPTKLARVGPDSEPVSLGTAEHWLKLCTERGFKASGPAGKPGAIFEEFRRSESKSERRHRGTTK
jgi:hypothetical protein